MIEEAEKIIKSLEEQRRDIVTSPTRESLDEYLLVIWDLWRVKDQMMMTATISVSQVKCDFRLRCKVLIDEWTSATWSEKTANWEFATWKKDSQVQLAEAEYVVSRYFWLYWDYKRANQNRETDNRYESSVSSAWSHQH